MEYSCAVAGAKLIVVMGHTSCGAVNASVDLMAAHKTALEATGCDNLDSLISEIQLSIDPDTLKTTDQWRPGERQMYTNEVSRRNVVHTMRGIRERSKAIDALVRNGEIAIVGAVYDVTTGNVNFFQIAESSAKPLDLPWAVPV